MPLLIILFLLSRIINLTLLPVFNDEAIYINWGQKMLASGRWFLPLFDGKQPLLMWIFGLFANIFPDPLFGGRLVSVISGLLSFLAVYKLFGRFASLLYIFSPIFLFFDRQALMESFLISLGLWTLYFLRKLITTSQKRYALTMGVLWGLGMFTKSSYAIFIFSSMIAIVWLFRRDIPSLVKHFYLIFPTCIVMLLPLLSQPDFSNIISLNSRFSFTLSELFTFPISSWLHNLTAATNIIFWLTTGPLFLISIYYLTKDRLMFFWLFSGLLQFVFFTKTPSSRYLVPFLPLTLVFIPLHKKLLLLIIPSLIFFICIDYLLIFQPEKYFQTISRLTSYSQSEGYLGSFTSGYGVKPAIDFIIKHNNHRRATVAVRLDAGNPENSTFMYLSKYPNFTLTYLDKRLPMPDFSLPVYFITRDHQLAGFDNQVTLLAEFKKPDQISSVMVYLLHPQPE